MKEYYVYIMASRKNGTLYIGVTNDIARRAYEHKHKIFKGFTSKYNVTRLVYAEIHDSIYSAIQREKLMKEWKRQWKIDLIESINPNWNDMYETLNA